MRRVAITAAVAALLSACSSSSSTTPTPQDVALPGGLTSVGALSVHGGEPVLAGRDATGKPTAWVRQGGAWQALSVADVADGRVRAVAHDGGDAWYVGWHEGWPAPRTPMAGLRGWVHRFRAGAFTDLEFPAGAVSVVALQVKSGVVYAGGEVGTDPATSHGQVWRWSGAGWQSLGLDPAPGAAGTGLGWPGLEGMAFSGDVLYAWGHPRAEGRDAPAAVPVVLRYRDGAWARLALPPLARFWATAADGLGGFYVSGLGPGATGQIWHWSGDAWTSIGPANANLIHALAVGADGSLYAGGIDIAGSFRGQVWRRVNGTWRPLGMPDAQEPQSIAVAPDGAAWVLGKDLGNALRLWKLAP